MRVVVTGLLATYPLGGVGWDYLAFVRGFQLLGAEVLYLEDTGQWLYDPRDGTFTDDVSYHLRYLAQILQAHAPGVRWSLRSPDGTYHGLDEVAVGAFCGGADLFLNVSGCCWLRETYRGARRKIYLDTDPGYSHAKLAASERGTATGDEEYSVGLIRAHDLFFTFAENMGDESCRLPAAGLRWQTTRQPIVASDWPFTYRPEAAAYTTVMSWKTDVTVPTIDGTTYGGKGVEFVRFADMPSRTPAPLEIAVAGVAPRADLQARGWRVVDAGERSATMEIYRDYLAASRGEWSVAKNAYVATRSGWFSCRTACYLTLGKPAVVQDTGFRAHYPTGEGLFAFSTADEAAAALAEVERDYRRHCEAARALALQEFDAQRVLTRLCAEAGL
jgi:hypothetical protein